MFLENTKMTDRLMQILYEDEVKEAEQAVKAAKTTQRKLEMTPTRKRRIDMDVANRMLGHALISVGVSCKNEALKDKYIDAGKQLLKK